MRRSTPDYPGRRAAGERSLTVSRLAGHDTGRPGSLRLATNTIAQFGGTVAGSAIGFVTFVVVTRGLGVAEFGAFSAALVFLFIPVVLADVGLSTAVLREISTSPERTEHAVGASIPLRFIVSTTAIGLSIVVALAAPLGGDTQRLILIGSLGSLVTLMSMSLIPVLQARFLLHWAAVGTVGGRTVTLALTVAFLETGFGLDSVMWAHVAGTVVTFAVQSVAVARAVRLRPKVDRPYWGGLLRGSIVIGLAGALAQVYFRVDVLLVEVYRTSTEVGLYGAALKLVEVALFIGAAVGMTFFPVVARLVSTAPDDARAFFRKTIDILIAATAPVAVLFAVRPGDLVVFISGEEFREAGTALRILAPYVLLSTVSGLLWSTLVASNADRVLLLLMSGVLVANVGVNIGVVPAFGYQGAAVTSLVTEAVVMAAFLALANRKYGFSLRVESAPGIAFAAAAMALVLAFFPAPLPVTVGTSAIVYATVLAILPGAGREAAMRSLPSIQRALAGLMR